MKMLVVVFAAWFCIGHSARADGPTLTEIALSILNEAVHAPIPGVIAPLVTAAESADSLAIAGLEIWLAQRERQILLQMASTPPGAAYNALLRQLKAVQAMKAAVAAIKMRRTQEEKQKQEDGWDPFIARYFATGPLVIPGPNSFTLALDGLADLPGDAPPGPMVALVTPPFAGITEPYIAVTASSATAMFTPAPGPPGSLNVEITTFSQTIGPFDLAPGVSTGPNLASLNEFGSTSTGMFTIASPIGGIVDMNWEGKYNNAIHTGRSPILFFAASHGVLYLTGAATMVADDPMIVPMPPSVVPKGEPWLRGGAVYSFDAATMTMRVNENTVVVSAGPPVHPDIAMMRDSEGRHTYRPVEDIAVGGTLVIPPMPYMGMVGAAHTFGDVPFSVVNGILTLLEGTVRGITLDPTTLAFEGVLDVTPTAYPVFSRSCNQIMNAPGPRRLVFATAGTVVDLIEVTASFTTSGTMPWPEIFALEATEGVACAADLNGDNVVDDSDFVIFVRDYNELLVPPASPWSDLNEDGVVNDEDFVPFVAAYNELICS